MVDTFNPDAYLQNAKASGFDADAYLASGNRAPVMLMPGFAAGAFEGFMHPFDRAAVALSKTVGAIPGVGPAIESAGKAMGMPSAEEATAGHQAFVEKQRASGIEPNPAGEVAGNVLATLPIAATGGPFTGGAVVGGLLSDSDTVGGTVADMLKGGAGGKVGDWLFRGLAAGSKPLTRYVANKIQDWTQPVQSATRDAAQYVYRLMGENAPADIRAAAIEANNKPLLAAEAIGRPGVTALATLGRRAGTTADQLSGVLSERAAGAGNRILEDYADIAGISPVAARGDMDALLENGRAEAAPLFKQALSQPGPVWNADLEKLANRPVVAKAIRDSADDLRNAGKDPKAYGLDFDPLTGKFTGATARPTAEAWDLIKKNVAGQVERDPFGKIIPDSISRGNYNIGVANRDLTAALRDAIPGYGAALDRSGDYLVLNKAFQDGQDFITKANVTAAQMASRTSAMSGAQLQAFKGGVANKLFDMAQTGKLSPAMFDRPILRQKLTAILGENDAATFLKNMKIEAQMKQTGGRMMPGTGSITSEVLNSTAEQNVAADAIMDAVHAGAYLAHGNAMGFGTRMLSAMRRLNPRGAMMPEAVRNEAGRLLMMSPAELADHLEAMQPMPPSVNRVANVIGAGRVPARLGAPALAVDAMQGSAQ